MLQKHNGEREDANLSIYFFPGEKFTKPVPLSIIYFFWNKTSSQQSCIYLWKALCTFSSQDLQSPVGSQHQCTVP